METVWIFTAPKAKFPSGAFTGREVAERWIHQHRLSGTLTAYPVDVGVYDWAVSGGHFAPKRDDQRSQSSFSASVQRRRSIIIMRAVTGANHPAAGKAGITRLLAIERLWPGLPELTGR